MKLGDFGISLVLPPIPSKNHTTYLRGITRAYSLPDVKTKWDDDEEVTKKLLWENDNYTLYTTFLEIFNKFKN